MQLVIKLVNVMQLVIILKPIQNFNAQLYCCRQRSIFVCCLIVVLLSQLIYVTTQVIHGRFNVFCICIHICIPIESVFVSLSQFIDGMTQVIQRLESHARNNCPMNALKDSLEGNSDQFTQDMILVKICSQNSRVK